MITPKSLLNDEQMRHFIVNGYITVKADLPPSFHEAIFQRTVTVFEKEGNPGNNLLPRIPAIQEVFDDATVDGALTSLLGPNYYMHPHRHPHYNSPGSSGQNIHKDSWTRRRHHTRWVMALYYPQDTPEEIGPTGIIPESHYYNTGPNGGPENEVALCGEAGTVVIVHYDLWHRAMPNRSDRKRYMMKFLFTRMEEPQYPSWDSEQVALNPDPIGAAWHPVGGDEARTMWAHLWNWHYGKTNGDMAGSITPRVGSVPELIKRLRDESESACLNAAYALGAIGAPAVPALIETLQDESETVRRNASYALSAMGAPAVPALISASSDSKAWVRAIAVDTLGDIGLSAQDAIPAVIKALQDESVQVRRNAAEALGIIGSLSSTAVPALIAGLRDADEWVRRNTSLALARIGPYATGAVPALSAALNDENRYVRANAMHALTRIDASDAKEAAFNFLWTARWCPSTTKESTF